MTLSFHRADSNGVCEVGSLETQRWHVAETGAKECRVKSDQRMKKVKELNEDIMKIYESVHVI